MGSEMCIRDRIKVEEEFKKCDLSEKLITRTQNENMERMIYADNYREAITYFKAHAENMTLKNMMDKYVRYKFYQNPEAVKKDIAELQPILDLTAITTQYEYVTEFAKKALDMKFVFTEEEKFNEDKFNSELEQYFAMIGELNNEAITLSKSSGPQEVIMIRNVLGKPYFSLVKAIRNYIPKGVDDKYLELSLIHI